ncbi:MAG TPA: type I methionyl aminopeptidase [Puia sp.]|nr:type I methionyl aminopeptidase [Puia sp.]
MIYYKTQAEIELIRASCAIVEMALAEAAKFLKPGVTTKQLDERIEELILDHQAIPSFKDYRGFPFASCLSVNEAVVHGFPSDKELKEGDIVSVDVGAFKNGFHGDSAYTFALGDPGEAVLELMRVTKGSLYKGIEKATAGNRIGDISFAVQDYAERRHGYGIVRELVGHGLGRHLHEDPQVANYGRRGTGVKMQEGLVIAIEPMVNLGTKDVYYDEDGWTVRTKDHKPAAHFEHTVCVQKMKANVLSSFAEVEKAENENPNLFSIK